jgi:hypothetical protein
VLVRLVGRGIRAYPGAYIVGVSEKSDTCNNTGPDMVPSKRCLINLSEGKASSLVRVSNVGEVIVEVVEGSVASGGFVYGGD